MFEGNKCDGESTRCERSGDKHDQQKLQGKAFQVNENSAGDQKAARSPTPPRRGSDDKHNEQKPRGKAFEVNENSVKDQGPDRLP